MRVSDEKLAEVFDEGFTVVEGFLSAEEVSAARDALWSVFPRPEDYFADPAAPAHARFSKSQFAGMQYFPFQQRALNRLTVHPDLVDAAERFCGTRDLELYKVELWAKYAGAIDYDQPHHRDFGNHTLVVPRLDDSHPQMTTFILLSDVTEETGPTKVVPLRHTRDLPLIPLELPKGAFADVELSVTAPAGSLFIYKTDVVHRGSSITGERASRFVMLVDFQRRGARWQGKMSWPDRALLPAMTQAMAEMTPRERELFGFPAAGDPYWCEQTLRDTKARYPGMDMRPYLEAAALP